MGYSLTYHSEAKEGRVKVYLAEERAGKVLDIFLSGLQEDPDKGRELGPVRRFGFRPRGSNVWIRVVWTIIDTDQRVLIADISHSIGGQAPGW